MSNHSVQEVLAKKTRQSLNTRNKHDDKMSALTSFILIALLILSVSELPLAIRTSWSRMMAAIESLFTPIKITPINIRILSSVDKARPTRNQIETDGI